MDSPPLHDLVLSTYDDVNNEHWGRLHRGGVVHLVAIRLGLADNDVHAIINKHRGEMDLSAADLSIPSDHEEYQ